MRQIIPPTPIVQIILGEQKTAGEFPCRLTSHCIRVERPEGILLYHTLTGELLLLSPEEAAALEGLPGPVSPAMTELAARWFLRPEAADDMSLADQTREIAERFTRKKKTVLTDYTIFTTTDCNARCFYCYEAGWNRSFMAERTALDTANYIAAHCGGKPVRLEWFGGEPLVNTRAIDVITDRLRQEGTAFRSTMISNGYLFDAALAHKAKCVWNLKEVKITLDGTEAVYNRRKAYVNAQGSPYQRVIGNIGLLMDEGVSVKIRLNMDENNERDLYALVDELTERFKGKPNFAGVCMKWLRENSETVPADYREERLRASFEKMQSLQAYVEKLGMMTHAPLARKFAVDACAADSDRATVVTPEGWLSRCASCADSGIWGSVCSSERDTAVLRQWKERKPPEPACKTCAAYPQCLRLKKCPGWLEHCSTVSQLRWKEGIRRAILEAYENWKATGEA